jgi:hypothetical protein
MRDEDLDFPQAQTGLLPGLRAGEPARKDEALLLTQDHFEHDPLDLASRSIRLLQIKPAKDSKEQIQCDLRLTSTDAQYTCLSYVWGDPDRGQWILVNGDRLWVRQNLWNFLASARKMPELRSRWIWVDAICIDQTNITEREHQVQQMGRIYSCAQEVISWLGINWKIAAMLITYPGRDNTLYQLHAYRDSPYWGRAWITQEIVLGRKLNLMVCDSILDITAIPEPPTLRFLHDSVYQNPVYRIGALRKYYQQKELPGKPLIELLSDFKFQQCHLTRDRVYSLLALCGDCTDLKVDYSISDADLALEIMRHCQDKICLCSIHILGDTLQMPSESQLAYDCPHRTGSGVVTLPMKWCNDERNWSEETIEKTCEKLHWVDTCSDTASSGVVIYKPCLKTLGLTLVSININLHELCSTYCGRVVVRMYLGRVGFFYQYFGSFAPLEWDFRRRDSGITLRVLEGTQSCDLALSLEFWLQLARAANRHIPTVHQRCCDRVVGQNAKQKGDGGTHPALRVSSD